MELETNIDILIFSNAKHIFLPGSPEDIAETLCLIFQNSPLYYKPWLHYLKKVRAKWIRSNRLKIDFLDKNIGWLQTKASDQIKEIARLSIGEANAGTTSPTVNALASETPRNSRKVKNIPSSIMPDSRDYTIGLNPTNQDKLKELNAALPNALVMKLFDSIGEFEVITSDVRVDRAYKLLQSANKLSSVKMMSVEEAKNLMNLTNLDFAKYEAIRMSALNEGLNIYPSYKQLVGQKKLCREKALNMINSLELTQEEYEKLRESAKKAGINIYPKYSSVMEESSDNVAAKIEYYIKSQLLFSLSRYY